MGGSFYRVFYRVFYRIFLRTFYGVLKRYQTQGVFCKLVCRVLQMIFYKAYKGHVV